MIVRVRAAVQVDPFRFGDAHLAGRADRGDHQRGGLIDEGVGVHVARIRKADPAVLFVDPGQLPGRQAVAPGGQRIGRGHRAEAGQQSAHRLHVLRNRACARGPDRVLEQRIEGDRRAQLVQVFMVVPAAPRIADQFGFAAGIFLPRYRQARPLDAVLRAQCFAADQQRRPHLAAGDRFGELVDQVLRHVAAVPRVQVPARLDPQARRHAARRVARGAESIGKAMRGVGEQPDHRHGIDRLGDLGRGAGIGQRQAAGLCDQVERRAAPLGGGGDVGHVATADQDGRVVLAHARHLRMNPPACRQPVNAGRLEAGPIRTWPARARAGRLSTQIEFRNSSTCCC